MTANSKEALLTEEIAIRELKTLVNGYLQAKVVKSEFNLIQEAYGNLNENAHTRIIAALLRIKPVRTFFFRFLDRKFPGRGLDVIADEDDKNAEVRCLENYLDALVSIRDYRIIIENKVKGAIDQPEQIDRYTTTILSQGVKKNNIFVLYITATGGFPSESSFNAAKEILDYSDDSNTGRFFALSYLRDVLPWLFEMLGRRIDLEIGESDRDLFRSGIIQYTHFIEGPALLSVREARDGYERFRELVRDLLERERSLSFIIEFCSWVDYLILRQRQYLCRCLSKDRKAIGMVSREEKQYVFKTLFYRAFDITIPEDAFYVHAHPNIGISHEMVASMGLWEEASIVQVDVWCTNKNSETYDLAFKFVNDKLNSEPLLNSKAREMEYNGHKMIRFAIDTIDDLMFVVVLLGGKIQIGEFCTQPGNILTPQCSWESFLPQLQNAVARWCARCHISADDGGWKRWTILETDDGQGNIIKAQYTYHPYVNNWAIQLHESTNTPMRAIDVFGSRATTADDVFAFEQYMMNQEDIFPFRVLRWDGRVYCRFPVPNVVYASKLLKKLWEWRANVKV